MNGNDLSDLRWRKSSYSNAQAQCVEVAELAGAVAVRDSKDPAGPALMFTRAQWRAFTAGLKPAGSPRG
jgi:Domain of unknown function (DUF397)